MSANNESHKQKRPRDEVISTSRPAATASPSSSSAPSLFSTLRLPKSTPAYVPPPSSPTASSSSTQSSVLPTPNTSLLGSLRSSIFSKGSDALVPSSQVATAAPQAPPLTWDPATVRALLKQTNLAHLRDAAVVSWLRDACDWVPETSAYPDIRFLVLAALDTLPWWRYMTTSGAGGGRVSRNHIKTFAQLERLCSLLVASSPHAVRGVVEITMKPFTCFPVSARETMGLAPVIPVEMICRVWNCIATTYPHLVPDTLLWQCIEPLMPKRRWPHVAQHLAFLKTLLHLALDATLTPEDDGLLHNALGGGGAGSGSDAYGVAAPGGSRRASGMFSPGDTSDAVKSAAGGGRSSSRYDSDATSTPSSASTSTLLHPSSSVTSPNGPSSSGRFPSDPMHANGSAASVQHLQLHTMAAMLDASAPHNNRLMVHRNAIIQLILRYLLDMELSFTFLQNTAPQASGTTAPRRGGTRGGPWQHGADPLVEEHDLQAYEVLRRCTDSVAQRLAEDLEAQGVAGTCGNAQWWREVQSFHVNSVLVLDRPVVLHTLAPRLAVLGTGGEVADLVHRVVTTVLKGFVHAWPPPSAAPKPSGGGGGRGGGQGNRGGLSAVPMMAPQVLPTDRRVAASRHIAPLVVCLTAAQQQSQGPPSSAAGSPIMHRGGGAAPVAEPQLQDSEVAVGAMRRMLKWLAHERHGAGGGSAGVHQSLLESVFAQVEFISSQTGVPLSDLSDDVIQSLRGALRRDASVAEGEEVACAVARGLVLPHLYSSVLGAGASSPSSSK